MRRTFIDSLLSQAQRYIAAGYGWVIDLDLEKFFDRVNHDELTGQIAKRVEDKRLLKLIRAFLNAGVMENGLVIRFHYCCPTLCSTNSTESSSVVATATFATRMIATST